MVKVGNKNSEEKLKYLLGGDVYHGWTVTLGKVIREEMNNNGVLGIPPDGNPWEIEGNSLYFRSFINPIKTKNITASDTTLNGVSHLLITGGIYQKTEYGGWPNFLIKHEKIKSILFINRETLKMERVESPTEDYTYSEGDWGVITLN